MSRKSAVQITSNKPASFVGDAEALEEAPVSLALSHASLIRGSGDALVSAKPKGQETPLILGRVSQQHPTLPLNLSIEENVEFSLQPVDKAVAADLTVVIVGSVVESDESTSMGDYDGKSHFNAEMMKQMLSDDEETGEESSDDDDVKEEKSVLEAQKLPAKNSLVASGARLLNLEETDGNKINPGSKPAFRNNKPSPAAKGSEGNAASQAKEKGMNKQTAASQQHGGNASARPTQSNPQKNKGNKKGIAPSGNPNQGRKVQPMNKNGPKNQQKKNKNKK